MVLIVKDMSASVIRAGPVMANPPGLPPVIMGRVPTAWTSTSRTFFPTNGVRYNEYESAIIGESDQTKWPDLVEEHLDKIRQKADGMSAAAVVAERARLVAWYVAYKAWAVI